MVVPWQKPNSVEIITVNLVRWFVRIHRTFCRFVNIECSIPLRNLTHEVQIMDLFTLLILSRIAKHLIYTIDFSGKQ